MALLVKDINMKINKKQIKASEEVYNQEIVITPAALLDILSKVDEFKDFKLGLDESLDGNLQLTVNDSVYDLTSESDIKDVQTESQTVEEVSDANEEAYSDLESSEGFTDTEEIEGGLVKDLIKTLAIGGLVRLGGSLAKDALK